jgi:hypothetical protein
MPPFYCDRSQKATMGLERLRFKTDKPAPDDETVRQWIDEQRMEKYG